MIKLFLFLLGALLLSCNAGYGRSLPDNSNENLVGKSVNPVIRAPIEKSPSGDKHEAVKLLLEEQQSGNHPRLRKRQIFTGLALIGGLFEGLLGAGEVAAGAGEVAAVAGELAVGTGEVAAGAGEVAAGAEEVAAGAGEGAAGAGEGAAGAGEGAAAGVARAEEDVLREATPEGVTRSGGRTTYHWHKQGDYSTAREDFEQFGIDYPREYAGRYRGSQIFVRSGTRGGTTVTVRSTSSGNLPTLEIRSPGGAMVKKIRYIGYMG